MTTPAKVNAPRNPPYKLAAVGMLVIAAVVFYLVYGQFRGNFTPKTKLTMVAPIGPGLVMDPGSKVTYNGVEIGLVGNITETMRDGKPAAKFTLDVYPKYLALIPENVDAQIKATTVFGGKYVSLTTPKDANGNSIARGHLNPSTTIDATAVTTEINTLFQTITSIAEKVDPVKLNLTLSAAAQSLTGLGDRFGQSIVNGNAILDDVNPQMPQARHDIQQLAALGDTYANACAGFVRLPQQRGGHVAHDQRTAEGFGPGVVVGGRIRQHRRRHLQAGRAVSGAWIRGPGAHLPSCWTPTARSCSARCATTTTSNPKPESSSAATATRSIPTPS